MNIYNPKKKTKKENLPKNIINNSHITHNNSCPPKDSKIIPLHESCVNNNHSNHNNVTPTHKGRLTLKPTWNLEMINEIHFQFLSI